LRRSRPFFGASADAIAPEAEPDAEPDE